MYQIPSRRGRSFFCSLNKHCYFSISPNLCSTYHLHKVIRLIILCFPLSLLPSTYPASVKFSKPSFFIMCLSNFNYLFLIRILLLEYPARLHFRCSKVQFIIFSEHQNQIFHGKLHFCCRMYFLHIFRGGPTLTAIEISNSLVFQMYFLSSVSPILSVMKVTISAVNRTK